MYVRLSEDDFVKLGYKCVANTCSLYFTVAGLKAIYDYIIDTEEIYSSVCEILEGWIEYDDINYAAEKTVPGMQVEDLIECHDVLFIDGSKRVVVRLS